MLVAALLSIVVDVATGKNEEGSGWISGVSILGTFFVVAMLSSISAYVC
jgi:hypothetical protein